MNCQDYLHRSEDPAQRTRRWVLGVGAMALANLLAGAGLASTPSSDPLRPSSRHSQRRPRTSSSCSWRARPAHLELFDFKPQLAKFNGTLPPADLLKGYRAAFINPSSTLLGPKFKFEKS